MYKVINANMGLVTADKRKNEVEIRFSESSTQAAGNY